MADSTAAPGSILTAITPMNELQAKATSQGAADSTEGIQPRAQTLSDGVTENLANDTTSPSKEDTRFDSVPEPDKKPALESLTDDQGSRQIEKEEIQGLDNGESCSAAQSATKRLQRLKRIGEADQTALTPGTDSRIDPPVVAIEVLPGTEKVLPDANHDFSPAIEKPEAQPSQASKYKFAPPTASDDEDEELDRQIDADLEQLSASVARLRKLAEEMGREVERQNQQLRRICC